MTAEHQPQIERPEGGFGPSAIATPANFVTITRLFVSPLLFAMLAKDDVSWGATLPVSYTHLDVYKRQSSTTS